VGIIFLIILATIFYTLFDIFASKASGKMDANLSSVLFNGIGAILPLVIYGYLKLDKKVGLIPTTTSGITNSLLAGVSIAIFSILLIKIFEKGGLSYVVPLIYGGSILLASLFGWLVFKESVSTIQLIGIFIILLGIGIVIYSKM
jgi:uncharacterized membrane protein